MRHKILSLSKFKIFILFLVSLSVTSYSHALAPQMVADRWLSASGLGSRFVAANLAYFSSVGLLLRHPDDRSAGAG